MSRLYQRALPYISLSLLHLFYSTQAALSWSVKRPGISLFWLLMLHPDIWSQIIVHPWDSGCPLLSLRLFLVSMPSCLPLVHFSVHCGRRAALQKLWTHSFHLVREGSHCPLESIILIFLLLCINFSNVYPFSSKFQRGTIRKLCTSTVCGHKIDTSPYSSLSMSTYMFSLCSFVCSVVV